MAACRWNFQDALPFGAAVDDPFAIGAVGGHDELLFSVGQLLHVAAVSRHRKEVEPARPVGIES